jgi:hypothetical protein
LSKIVTLSVLWFLCKVRVEFLPTWWDV